MPMVGTPRIAPLERRLKNLQWIIERLQPVPDSWLEVKASGLGADELPQAVYGPGDMQPRTCTSWRELVGAWRKALKWEDGLEGGLAFMLASAVSTPFVGEQLWGLAEGPPSSGKTTIMEGLAVAKRWCLSKDTLRGFNDGHIDEDGEDRSLVALARGKTLLIKDGDTLLKSPELPRILSEARGLYDKTLRTHYRNHKMTDYTGHRMSLIICGTRSLREIDESELGTRFLTWVFMEGIDDDFEDEVIWRAVHQEARNMRMLSDGKPETQYPPELANAMALTGGYVDHLRLGALDLSSEVRLEHDHLHLCGRLGKYAAYMRARPPKKSDEETDRECGYRLAKQLVRLATSLAVVMQDRNAGDGVMARVRKVALDTSRGLTASTMDRMMLEQRALAAKPMATYLNRKEEDVRRHLRFLKHIGVCDFAQGESAVVWQPSPKIKRLWREVHEHA